MAAEVIDLKNADDPRDVVQRVVAALAAGQIVAFPTETVYGVAANALDADSVNRLSEIKGRDPSKPFSFAVKSLEDALDYVPDMPPLARRLARRCWPGPITLVLENQHEESVIRRLPEDVQKVTVPQGTVGLRVPAHELTLQVLRLKAGPIVLTSANLSGQEAATTADQVVEQLGDKIDLIVDDGTSKFGQASSVVKVSPDNSITTLREGVIDANTLKRLSGFIALVVCTGNTCRSPMGEALMKRGFAEKLNCEPEELEDKGVSVFSCGIAAGNGGRASAQSVEVMKNMGMDITNHSSQPITGRLAQFADLILTLTNGHRQALVNQWPSLGPRTKTLRRDGADISDPIGMSLEVYQQCAEQMDANLKEWLAEIEL